MKFWCRQCGFSRFYIQLPTEAAHEFHSESPDTSAGDVPHRLHPKVSEKLREIVSNGEIRLYPIRNRLRYFSFIIIIIIREWFYIDFKLISCLIEYLCLSLYISSVVEAWRQLCTFYLVVTWCFIVLPLKAICRKGTVWWFRNSTSTSWPDLFSHSKWPPEQHTSSHSWHWNWYITIQYTNGKTVVD